MFGSTTSSQRPHHEPISSSRPPSASKTLLIDHAIRRISVDPSTVLGCFYDARTERVVGRLPLAKSVLTKISQPKDIQCIIIKADVVDNKDIFRTIGIHEEPWLNSILNIVPSEGVTALINYAFSRSSNTRFLYYYYSSEEQSVSQTKNTVVAAISKAIPDITATHVVSAIKLGVQALLVLQLSSNDETSLDCLLEDIAQQLLKGKFQVSRDEKLLFDRIIVTKVFSNIPILNSTPTLFDICQKITEIKPHLFRHCPLEFTLRTIKWFYPTYPNEKARYIPLEPETLKTIRQYVLLFSSQIEELNTSLGLEDKEILEEHFKDQYVALQQQLEVAEQIYSNELERIRDLVIKIRSGIILQKSIIERLSDEFNKSLRNNVNPIVEYFEALRKKVQLIKRLDERNIKYFNMQHYSIQQNDDLNTIFHKLWKESDTKLVFCSIDEIKFQYASKWKDQRKQWMEEGETNPSLFLVFADFTYTTTYHLSEIKVLLIEPVNCMKRHSETSKLTSEVTDLSIEQSEKIEGPLSQLTASQSLDTRSLPPEEKQSMSADEKLKPPQSQTPPMVEVLNGLDDPSEEIKRSTHSTSLSNKLPDNVEKLTSTRQSSPRTHKQSTNSKGIHHSPRSENMGSSNERVNHEEKQCDTSQTSMMSGPPIVPRTTRRSSGMEEQIMPPTMSESSCTERPSPRSSARQRRQPSKSGSPSNLTETSISSTAQNTTLSTNEINNTNELINTSHLPLMLSPRAVPQTKKQSTFTEESLSTNRSFLPEKAFMNADKPPKERQSQKSVSMTDISLLEREADHSKTQSNTQEPGRPSTGESSRQERPGSSSSHSPHIKHINILLLGESGVGKSTFINALLNYHAFQTFEEARSNEPFVAMPVSFLMTVGNDFEEKTVRFGGIDSNEDHDHPGQSVTQHCRSYIFSIDAQTKLRIIDTPGMGDTRGLEQDDLNMQHILSFINNLSHLNAICILLKPNESRLNVCIRSYFSRLLNFLGENARNNIVFCFTNTRATFFAPGNTGPLLKNMINSLPIKDIPFGKGNTFCFDSESFRYLVALRNNIQFDTYQENEYQQSWTASSTTSNRLINYILKELKPYSQNKWQSIEHAQFRINQLIRPILETTRNILRNITLLKQKSSALIIKLRPIVLPEPSALCYEHRCMPQRFVDFWIWPDQLHRFSDKCSMEDCERERHVDVSYSLEYELTEYEGEESFEKMKLDVRQLRIAIVEFGEFYAYVVDILHQNDPMLSALEQIIAEEDQICLEKGATCLNSTLHNSFIGLTLEYKERQTSSMSIHLPVDLPIVYEQIKMISKIAEIKEQVRAMKRTQQKYLSQHEKQVS